jgi:hypothetical protein
MLGRESTAFEEALFGGKHYLSYYLNLHGKSYWGTKIKEWRSIIVC